MSFKTIFIKCPKCGSTNTTVKCPKCGCLIIIDFEGGKKK